MTISAEGSPRRPRHLAHWIALGFGAGLAPVAPGTVGTLAAIPLYLLLEPLPAIAYAALVSVLFLLGVWACGKTARDFNDPDPSAVVWDEVVGFLITMFMAPAGWVYVVIGFVLFRVFDILKPFPINALQSAPGGWGILLDDVLAGVYAALLLRGIAWLTT